MKFKVVVFLVGCLLASCSSSDTTNPVLNQVVDDSTVSVIDDTIGVDSTDTDIVDDVGKKDSLEVQDSVKIENPSDTLVEDDTIVKPIDKDSTDDEKLESVILVGDLAALSKALIDAKAGDVIVVKSGEYKITDLVSVEYAGMTRNICLYSHQSGTTENPITVRSEDPKNKAIIIGPQTDNSNYLLWINGENWVVENIVLKNGGKGLMLDEASNSVIDGVEIYDIGDEGLHFRSGTCNTVVKNSIIERTGLAQPGFGEGVYVGSDGGQWEKYAKECNNNIIDNCVVKSTGAEPFDIKEGTVGTVISNCKVYGDGVSGSSNNYADSFVDLKGNDARVFGNTFYQAGNANVTRGVAIVDRAESSSGTGIIDYYPEMSLEDAQKLTVVGNWIYENSFEMDGETGFMIYAYRGVDNYAWDNSRSIAGDEYKGNKPELYTIDPR